MTIKKPIKKTSSSEPSAAAPQGGAAIASRLQLNAPDEDAKAKPLNTTAVKVAFIAALLALLVAGILTYVLYQHWEFLMPA